MASEGTGSARVAELDSVDQGLVGLAAPCEDPIADLGCLVEVAAAEPDTAVKEALLMGWRCDDQRRTGIYPPCRGRCNHEQPGRHPV